MILRNEKKGKQGDRLIYNQFKKRDLGSRFKVQRLMLGTGHPERGNVKNIPYRLDLTIHYRARRGAATLNLKL
jgi:hypothetical protein